MDLIVKRGALRLPKRAGEVYRGRQIAQGQALPTDHGLLDEEVERLIEIGVLGKPEPPAEPQRREIIQKGKWCHDPASLVGKTEDVLRLMALETDPTLDAAAVGELAEADLVRLLSSDFHPVFATNPARSEDRARPTTGKPSKVLAAARRAAQAPAE